jgi:hypothetical protein
MDDLVAWCRQQLDEDERIARAAAGGATGVWVASVTREGTGGVNYGPGPHDWPNGGNGIVVYDEGCPNADEATHIARHDPARVLQDVEAKRRSLDELLRLPHYAWDGREEYGCPKATDAEIWRQIFEGDQVCNCGRDEHVDRSLRLLALPYADRPGYLEVWRP